MTVRAIEILRHLIARGNYVAVSLTDLVDPDIQSLREAGYISMYAVSGGWVWTTTEAGKLVGK